eukprot:CAMPEP_0117426030 /NCGR_PEP_ID=MMETSP0758-20121206/6213_1 /TAXON_ID=63605 /ORGANISM="Percolomonas cosmopolitus, Strain AE-1 (ATCC 50343)" /LENGTH=86 /DNA_ID=CAMNT_0005210929 /DNA_START=212 /DNA_END=472 /DNA_ORIENTATION=-
MFYIPPEDSEEEEFDKVDEVEEDIDIRQPIDHFKKMPLKQVKRMRKRQRLNYQQRLTNAIHPSWETAAKERFRQQRIIHADLQHIQ